MPFFVKATLPGAFISTTDSFLDKGSALIRACACIMAGATDVAISGPGLNLSGH
jgi:hypothetical protein